MMPAVSRGEGVLEAERATIMADHGRYRTVARLPRIVGSPASRPSKRECNIELVLR